MAAAQVLVIRRGEQGQHIHVPDTGAVVEIIVRSTPPPRKPNASKRFLVVRDGDSVKVTQL
jgi:hypothetical protein